MKTIILNLFFFISLVSFGQTEIINDKIISKINHNSENPVHSILLHINNKSKNFTYNGAFGLTDKNGEAVANNSRFKIASSTKLFVATIILQLEEEGKININDKAFPYLMDLKYLNFENFHTLNKVKYAKEITIKQLLSHRSGLADIFTDKQNEFFGLVMNNPTKQYSPKSIVQLYHQFNLNNTPHFKPNNGWYYSDINYLLLGLIIEQVDKTTLSKAIRNRILDPLKMENTYFEFYETPKKKVKPIQQYIGANNFSKINTSFDWSGGGLVSTNLDLAIYIEALFNLKLINQNSLDKMIDVKFTKKNESRYGLGVYEFAIKNDVFYGHFGFYGTFVGYSPTTKTTISYSVSQATPNFNVYKFIIELLNLAKN
jgi:D-alanyl-D-alanine carboxypeptidase